MSVRGVLIYPLRRVGVNCEYCGKVQVERHADRPDWVSIHHRCDNPSPGPNQPPMWRKISETEFVGELPPLPESAEAKPRGDITTDGPHNIEDHRRWLARQLLDSNLSADEAYSIVEHSPALKSALAQSNRRLREGLAFYAGDEAWETDGDQGYDHNDRIIEVVTTEPSAALLEDKGQRARAALKDNAQ